jgi:Crinkler effector protein N-terminal domain
MNLGGDDLRLYCVIEGETEVFPVDVEGASWHNPRYIVSDLKRRIREERKDDSLANVGVHSLELWKVRAIDES